MHQCTSYDSSDGTERACAPIRDPETPPSRSSTQNLDLVAPEAVALWSLGIYQGQWVAGQIAGMVRDWIFGCSWVAWHARQILRCRPQDPAVYGVCTRILSNSHGEHDADCRNRVEHTSSCTIDGHNRK